MHSNPLKEHINFYRLVLYSPWPRDISISLA